MKLSLINRVFVLASVIMASPTAAMAQQMPPEGHSNVVPAVLVFLCVTLGLILVNRSAGRRSEILIDEIDDE